MIHVRSVNGDRAGMADFLEIPYRLYRDDPHWCPPLRLERRKFFGPANPFMRQGRVAWFVAYDGVRPVGRVTAQIDELHNRHYGVRDGFFGFYESVENPEVAWRLMEKVESWLTTAGMTAVRGPYNFNTKQEVGFLTEGFAEPPFLMMPYTKPYYPELLERLGYVKEKGLVSFRIDSVREIPPLIAETARRLEGRYGGEVRIEALRRSRLHAEEGFIREIYNDAWGGNWGFIPITQEEIAYLIDELKPFGRCDFIYKLHFRGEPAAFMLNLPNINEVLIGIRSGRLFPRGLLRLLFSRRTIKTAVITILGVKSRYRNLGLELLLYKRLFEDHRARPFAESIETTWILEDNRAMIRSLEHLRARLNKRYVIVGKSLIGE